MESDSFRDVVHRAATKILEHNYQIQETSSLYTVEFQNVPVMGVYCLIGFDLVEASVIPNKFKVLLIRRRLEDFLNEDSLYKPLIMDLRNLMLGLYKINIFPPKHYDWEFIDVESLTKQIEHAQEYIVNYGITWLEDPDSDLNW